MGEMYKKIFEPYQLKTGDVLKNRIIYPNAQQTYVVGPEEWPTPAMIDDMMEFGYSGASLMCFGQFDEHGGGAVPNKHTGKKSEMPGFDYSLPGTWNYLSQTAFAAHCRHTKLLVKLAPAFPKGYSYWGGDAASLFPPIENDPRLRRAKSGMNDFMHKRPTMTMEEMKARIAPKEMIKDVIQDLVDLCKRYKKAGWDGMSFRADRFIDAATNIREDEYGGEIENRGRFQLELYTAIKEACGKDFIIEIALMGNSPYGHDGLIPHGYSEEEFIRFCMLVEDVVDIVEVREQSGVGYQCCGYNSTLHDHPCLKWAEDLRNAGFKGTIAVNGGFADPVEMEEILEKGVVDFISIGRALRAEPRFIQKLRTEGKEQPTPCLRCNKCHCEPSKPIIAGCAVNPRNALANHLPVIEKPTDHPKKVAVIGGGPIGMRAACMAAEKGHDVTLFEKDEALGGKTRFYAPLYKAQWPMDRYRLWCIDELDRRGVKVRLNCAPEPEELTAEGFDAVIACTGSKEKRPPIQGADAAGVWLDQDVYEGKAELGQNIVIVGGGTVATETAMYLASIGKNVTILTRAYTLMRNEARPHGPFTQFEFIDPEKGYGGVGSAWGIYDNLKPVYEVTTTMITPKSVSYVDSDGIETVIECDSVVVSGGYEPLTGEALKYGTCTDEFYMAGDCDIRSSELMSGNLQAYGAVVLL
ncbi:MAG: FAD-dependent oxidoreductase [Lachnospiraceae bacterium]|nr:FAD-dependent oxidoreductase [Lachnospiraceae bacterium]